MLYYKYDVEKTDDFIDILSQYGSGTYLLSKGATHSPSETYSCYVLVWGTHVYFEFGAIAINSDTGDDMHYARPNTINETCIWHKISIV